MTTEIEEKVEFKNGIKYTTYFVDRPIKIGDPEGYSKGENINGIQRTTEVVYYVYNSKKINE